MSSPAQVGINHAAITEAAGQLSRVVLENIRFDDSGCWIWTGILDHTGYGRYRLDRQRTEAAHRFVYKALVGEFDPDLDLDHLCRVRACVNPAHLEPVTRQVNLLRGLTLPAANVQKTHCKRGHPYAGDNLVIEGKGRKCRECLRLRAVQRRAAKRAANPRAPKLPPTHCKWGHPMSGDNLLIHANGVRVCRACRPRYQATRIERLGGIDEVRRLWREQYHRRKASQ